MRVITLPNGRKVSASEYVRSWKVLKTLPPHTRIDSWNWHTNTAADVLNQIRKGVHHRIYLRGQ